MQKMARAASTVPAYRQVNDAGMSEDVLDAKAITRIERLAREAAEIHRWLADHPDDRPGARRPQPITPPVR